MYVKCMFVAIAILFCCGAYAEEDIVYQNDWRAGETGYVTGDRTNTHTYYRDANDGASHTSYTLDANDSGDYGYNYEGRPYTRKHVHVWSAPSIGYHTGQPYTRDDRVFPGRRYQENRDDRTFPGRGFQPNRDDRTFPGRGFQENRDDKSFPGRGFQESHDDRW